MTHQRFNPGVNLRKGNLSRHSERVMTTRRVQDSFAQDKTFGTKKNECWRLFYHAVALAQDWVTLKEPPPHKERTHKRTQKSPTWNQTRNFSLLLTGPDRATLSLTQIYLLSQDGRHVSSDIRHMFAL